MPLLSTCSDRNQARWKEGCRPRVNCWMLTSLGTTLDFHPRVEDLIASIKSPLHKGPIDSRTLLCRTDFTTGSNRIFLIIIHEYYLPWTVTLFSYLFSWSILFVILLTQFIYSTYILIIYFTKYSILLNVLGFVSSDIWIC